jgi:hypothetical protein
MGIIEETEVMMEIVERTGYDEMLEFLVSAPSLEQIISFRVSAATQERISYLLDANRANTLTADQKDEMEEISRLNHVIGMLKALAREKQA